MKFTDLFIRRPVLAGVISLLIVVLGLRSLFSLPVNQYPKTQNAVVTISTTYYGADAATVAGFITQPLEGAIAQAQGIDYLSSSSATGVSTITATLRLNYDANRALTEINTQVNSVKNQLPRAGAGAGADGGRPARPPTRCTWASTATTLPTNNVTDFLLRVVKPKLDSDRRRADRRAARRAPVRAARLARRRQDGGARPVGAPTSAQALATNNYLAALGASKGQMVTRAADRRHRPALARRVQAAGRQAEAATPIVRLEDVANVTLGSENYDFNVAFSGVRSVFIGIKVAPEANILDVAKRVREAFPDLAEPAAHRRDRRDRLRLHRLHQHLDQRSGQDAGRGAGDRHRGDLPVPRHASARCSCRWWRCRCRWSARSSSC